MLKITYTFILLWDIRFHDLIGGSYFYNEFSLLLYHYQFNPNLGNKYLMTGFKKKKQTNKNTHLGFDPASVTMSLGQTFQILFYFAMLPQKIF